MATTFTTPNMGMVIPVVGQELGPAWATDIFNVFANVLDTHNHTAGKGVQVPTAGININADLGFTSFNATALRSTRYTAQGSPLNLGTDKGCLYVSGVDLWYNDTSGNQIRLTNTGNSNFSFLAYPERTPAISGNFTILATDQFNLYYVDTSGGVATINLPASSGVAVGRTYIFVDIKRNAGTNNITIVPNGADKVNTVAGNYAISSAGSATILTTDAAGNWYANTILGSAFDPLNIATNLQWVSGLGNPTLTQASSASNPANTLHIKSQPSTTGQPGNIELDIPLRVGAAGAQVVIFDAANPVAALGDNPSTAAAVGNLWLSSQAQPGTASNGNFSLQGNGTDLLVQAPTASGLVHFRNTTAAYGAVGGSGGWQLGSDTVSFGGGVVVIGITNATTEPTGNPTGGAIDWAFGGARKCRGSGGAIKTIAPTGAGTQNTQSGVMDGSLTFARTTVTGATFTVDTPVPTNTTLLIEWRAIGRLVSGTGTVGDTGMAILEALYKNVSGTVTHVGTDNTLTTKNDTNFNMGSASTASGTNARITTQAPSSEGATPTIDWEIRIRTTVC